MKLTEFVLDLHQVVRDFEQMMEHKILMAADVKDLNNRTMKEWIESFKQYLKERTS